MNTISRTLSRSAWWQRATPREHTAVGVGAVAVVIALAYGLIAQPMYDALVNAPQDRAQRKAQLTQARERLDAIRTLTVGTPPRIDARTAIERALDRQGIARRDATIDTANDRVALTLPAVRLADAVAIIALLAQDGLRVDAATLAARADAPQLRAELNFTRATR